MSDRPLHDAASAQPGSGAGRPGRSLSEILAELAQASMAAGEPGGGNAPAMRGAVSELSRALAKLFELIRADRARGQARIDQLETELADAQRRLALLDGDSDAAAAPTDPDPADFDALRDAAERLRVRTARIVQEAAARRDAEETEDPADPLTTDAPSPSADAPASDGGLPTEPLFAEPAVLRVFPGAFLPSLTDDDDDESSAADLDVESELALQPQPQAVAVDAANVPANLGAPDAAEALDAADGRSPARASEPSTTSSTPFKLRRAEPEPELDPGSELESDPAPSAVRPPEPLVVGPRVRRKRRASIRRRRIDARKLVAVEPTAALRAMVSSIDELWTAGTAVDLVVALTDGGALHVRGGDRLPLEVVDVPPGSPARCTVTATSAQLVPLFGRLELTNEQSAPLIHGSRRDADLLVGWIDRAQRLQAQPL